MVLNHVTYGDIYRYGCYSYYCWPCIGGKNIILQGGLEVHFNGHTLRFYIYMSLSLSLSLSLYLSHTHTHTHFPYPFLSPSHTCTIQCSVTCGTGGMRTRDTFCVQARHNETTFELILDENNATVFVEVDRDLCLNTTEPSTTIPCDDRIPCPIRWRPLVWASVSACKCHTH